MLLLAGECYPICPDLFEVDGTESQPNPVALLLTLSPNGGRPIPRAD